MENSAPIDEISGHRRDNYLLSGMREMLIVIGLVLILGLIGSLFAQLIIRGSGMELKSLLNNLSENNNLENRNLIRYANLIIHLMSFTLPCLILAFYIRRKKWYEYLSLDKLPEMGTAFWACLIILVSMPFTNFVYWLNMQLPLPEWAKTLEEGATEMINALLTMDSPGELFINLLTIALVPAIGEELLFRGVFQKILSKILRKEHLAVWITAFLFSMMHLQFEGFFSRFLLGALLGYLYSWSRNLWIPILTHFFFNGIQIVVKYFAGDLMEGLEAGSTIEPGWVVGLVSLGLTLTLAIYLRRSLLENDSMNRNNLNK